MSKHVKALMDCAESGMSCDAKVAVRTGAAHLAKVEHQNQIMKTAINEAVKRNCLTYSDTVTGENYDILDHLKAAHKTLAALRPKKARRT
jgi:hypothetical protein